MDITKKIIATFLHHPMPMKVQEAFRLWCLDPERGDLKSRLLKEEWDRLDPASVLRIDEGEYRRKLARLHAEMRPARPRGVFGALRSFPRRMAAAAAVLLLIAGTANFLLVERLAAERATTTFVTAENGRGRFELPDKTVVWLNSGSRLTFSGRYAGSDRRCVRLEGEAFFDVRKDSLRPFVVELDKFQVRVLGTRFNVCNSDAFDTKEVTLLDGRVEILSDRLKRPIPLAPDQSCIYDTRSRKFTVRRVAASNYCNWRNDTIVFENTPLSDILTNVEHRYNVRFRIDRDIDLSVRLSFTLHPEPLENTLSIITTLANLRSDPVNEHHIRLYR